MQQSSSAQDGDYFEAAGVSLEQFETDNSACRTQADDHLTYDLPGMDGTRYQGNRTFNAIYGRCMTGAGLSPTSLLQKSAPKLIVAAATVPAAVPPGRILNALIRLVNYPQAQNLGLLAASRFS